jgi:hypothetical protein
MKEQDTAMVDLPVEEQARSAEAQSGQKKSVPKKTVAGESAAGPVLVLKNIFSFPVMLGGLLVTGVYAARREFDVDPDFWWHLKIGDGILATHQWPTADHFSFTAAGNPWLAAEWLSELLFSAVNRVGGLRGLEALFILLGAAIMVALYVFATLRSKNSKAGFVAAAVLLVLATANFNLRPQMLGYLFLILTLIALERFRQGHPRALWFLPPLFLLWVNTHPSWEIGLGTIFVYWMSGWKEMRVGGIEMHRWTEPQRIRLACTFLLCLAVLPITPYGTRLAAFPFQFVSALPENLANIIEWQPMPFDQPGPKLFLILVFVIFAAQIAFKLVWRLEEVALFFFGVLMACLHARFLLVFVPFCAALLATTLALWVPKYDRKKDQYLLNGALLFAMVFGMIWYFPSRAAIERNVAKHFPVHAVEYLREHPLPGPTFNAYNFAGYLVWAIAPEHRVFIDGRGELYEPAGVFPDYMRITLLKPGALDVLRSYGIRSCLLERDQPLATVLSARADWQKVYSDSTSVIFIYETGAELTAAARARNVPMNMDKERK